MPSDGNSSHGLRPGELKTNVMHKVHIQYQQKITKASKQNPDIRVQRHVQNKIQTSKSSDMSKTKSTDFRVQTHVQNKIQTPESKDVQNKIQTSESKHMSKTKSTDFRV